MKHVIHIFGGSGSGTTTLGKKISQELGYKHMDTDDYFWMPTDPKFTQKRPQKERVELMLADIANHENVVISGSLADWGDDLIPHFTLAVRIELDPSIRIARLIRREQQRFGDRVAPGGDMYAHHLEFVEWAKAYDTAGPEKRSRARHDLWQKRLSCQILYLDGAGTVEENFRKVKAAL